MIYHKFFLFLCVISMSRLMRYVCPSTLSAESIVNGIVANQSDFPYQVVILDTSDPEEDSQLLCNGALVSAVWILSIASCFMLNSIAPKPLMFTAIVGTSNISSGDGSFQKIVYIYTEYYDYLDSANDITMARAANAFVLNDNVNIIQIPNPKTPFFGRNGVVSGYGSSKVERVHNGQGESFYIETESDFQLRYTKVKYIRSRRCIHEFPHAYNEDKFCGVAARDYEGRYTGMCSNDNGSPLVIDRQVIGLSVGSYIDCDDTSYGSLYMDVADYWTFINNLLMETPKKSYKRHDV